MSSVKKFQHDLGRELVGAAHREADAQNPSRAKSKLSLLPVFGICAVVLIAIATLLNLPGPFGADDAVAETFEITRLDDRIELDIIDIVNDPTEVTSQLQTELGLQVEIFAVASDPQLVGQINAVGSSGDTAPQLTFNDDGAVTQVILPVGFEEGLIIEYGRPATPGEPYIMTVTSPICADFFGRQFSEIKTSVDALADVTRYEIIDQQGLLTPEVELEEIDSTYVLTDIAALSNTSYLVTYSANTTSRTPHPNCQ